MPQDDPKESYSFPLEEMAEELDPKDRRLLLILALLLDKQKKELMSEIRRLRPLGLETAPEVEAHSGSWEAWWALIRELRPGKPLTESYRVLLEESYERNP